MNIDVNELAQSITAQWIERCLRRGHRPRAPSPSELATVAILVAAIRAGPSSSSTTATRHDEQLVAGNQLHLTIEKIDRQMDSYENPESLAIDPFVQQDEALEHIPLQELHEKAEVIQSSNEPLPCFEDALAESLVRWFRDDFFVWVDRKTEKCPVCQAVPLKLIGTPTPTDEESRQGRANRVEVYNCTDSNCSGTFRFPRYNDLSTLMRTRVGRCGEFANLFTLFLRAWGYERNIFGIEKTMFGMQWVVPNDRLAFECSGTQYWSPAQERWIHLDSCEAARDQPLLYSKGWNKFMTYCLAFSCDGAMDVSKGYILNEKWADAMSHRNVLHESDLSKALKNVTIRRRMGRPSEAIRILEEEDGKMERWLNASDAVRGGQSELEERKSGNDEWKQSRGEAGAHPSD